MESRRWIAALLINCLAVGAALAEPLDMAALGGDSLVELTAADIAALPREVPHSADDWLQLATAAAPAASSIAEAETTADPSHESVWLVNTRTIPGVCDTNQALDWRWSRFDCGTGWQSSTWEDFQATDDPKVTTVILIHGYRHSHEDARSEGLLTWRKLRASCCATRVRFVIWSWPTEPCQHRLVKDVANKACRSELDARCLATLIAKIAPNVRICVIGFSLGGRVSCGALHLLAGGAINGRHLAVDVPPRQAPLRSLLVAAAVDEDWLMPNRRYGHAINIVDRMGVFYNPHDIVLHHYRKLSKRGGVQAIGYRGPSGVSQLGEDASKIWVRNANGELHRRHGWTHYLASDSLMAIVRSQALFLDLPSVNGTAQAQQPERIDESRLSDINEAPLPDEELSVESSGDEAVGTITLRD